MRFVVMNPEERFTQNRSNGFAGTETDHESMGQPGALRGRNRVQISRGKQRRFQSRPRDGHPVPQVLASRQFGHHTSVDPVRFNLGRNYVGTDKSIDNYRGAGVITGSL